MPQRSRWFDRRTPQLRPWRPEADSAGARSSAKKPEPTQQYLQRIQAERSGVSLVSHFWAGFELLGAQTLPLRRPADYWPVGQIWSSTARLVRLSGCRSSVKAEQLSADS